MADCRLCKYGEKWICEKTDGPMIVTVRCAMFEEFIDNKSAVDENMICDWYEHDDDCYAYAPEKS